MSTPWAIAGLVVKELYRRKDFYVLFVLTAVLTMMLGGMNFFGDIRAARYLKELCLLLIWISVMVIAIATAARQIPAEKEHRTIFPLLAKPVTRWHVILGKFLGCWVATCIALLVFYLFFGVMSAAREKDFVIANYAYALFLHGAFAAVVTSMTILGSVTISTPSANTTLCFIVTGSILFMGRHLGQIAQKLVEPASTLLQLVYFSIPHLEFFDLRDMLVHNHAAISFLAFLGAMGYAALYSAFFLCAAWLVFRKKPLNT